jgi:hypothetical protein
LDSRIVQGVTVRMTRDQIPVLSIHDSFITQAKHQERLLNEMARASTSVLGGPFKTETTTGHRCHDPQYDDPEPHPSQLIVADGYRNRLKAWEMRQAQKETEDLY